MNAAPSFTLPREIDVSVLNADGSQHRVRVLAETRAEAIEQAKSLIPNAADSLWLPLFVGQPTDLSAA